MTENVRRLRDAVGWTGSTPAIDWRVLSEAVGMDLPDEYKALTEAFPPGEFQTFLEVLHPAAHPGAGDFVREISGYAATVGDWGREQPEPQPVYPAAGGLIPWAIVGFDYVLCWRPDDGDPDRWPTVVCSSDDEERWPTCDRPTAAVLLAVVTEPGVVEELDYIAEEVQPPAFIPREGYEPQEPAPRPSAAHWIADLEAYTPSILPTVPAADLAPLVQATPVPGFDESAFLRRAARALPGDYIDIVKHLGAVTVGPARLLAPDGTDLDFFAEGKALAKRVAKEREGGHGPRGTIHPESDGMILWGRLDGGGFLGWARVSGDPYEWPVMALDASLRQHVTYPMSTSVFLHELATNPPRTPTA